MPKKSAFFLKFSSQISLKAEHQEDCLWGQTLLWIIKKLVTLSYTENLFSEDLLRPNISGSAKYIENGGLLATNASCTGSFYAGETTTSRLTGEGQSGTALMFSAKNSSAIFGKSTTVQPTALQLIPCIKS